MDKLLARGAFPLAALHLLEALREYERDTETRPREPVRHDFYYSRRRSEFSWQDVFSELYDDPLEMHCLHRANWANIRPKLFANIYVTERDNLVIEVVPVRDGGDFRRFFAYTAPFSRPSNRVLYIPLGRLAGGLGRRAPWDTGMDTRKRYAAERHLLALAVRSKLHQLSLYFDCYREIELVEFGPDNLIDFRRVSAQVNRDRADALSFDPAQWTPPRIREFLSTSGTTASLLYAFATEYLASLPEELRVSTYAQFLAGTHANRITEADVAELLEFAQDPDRRKTALLSQLTTDTRFGQHLREDRWRFASFCRGFSLDAEKGVEWVFKHHPDALDCVNASSAFLVRKLKSPTTRQKPELVEKLDGLLAAPLMHRPQSWQSAVSLAEHLEGLAEQASFDSFEVFQRWAKKAAPKTGDAAVALAAWVHKRIQTLHAEELAKRRTAAEKRKSARAARNGKPKGGVK